MKSRVKICGITSLQDAQHCEALGADLLGFIFTKQSKRFITPAAAAKIIAQLKHAQAVGVFVEHSTAEIEAIANDLQLNAVQIYTPHDLQNLSCRVIHALRIAKVDDLKHLQDLRKNFPQDYFLLDAYHPTQMGGSGQAFDWNLLPRNLSRCFLSGGIHPDNVKEALSYQPDAIDLCSGVEASPGQKDLKKLQQLFARIHHASL